MNLLRDWKLQAIAIAIIVLAEMVGKRQIGIVIFFPMLYAMIFGGIISLPKFKILEKKSMDYASAIMGVSLVLLVAKLGTAVGASWNIIVQATGAIIMQEIGHFIGTILLGLPLAVLLGMGREAVGATYSIGREPNIAVVEAKYGLDSPEGRGVMATYICGTLFGAIWMSILASTLAGLDILHPFALAMGAGVGSGSMLAASVAPLVEYYPALAQEIRGFASTANLISSVLGIYIYIFFSLPFASFLYDFLARRKQQPAQ